MKARFLATALLAILVVAMPAHAQIGAERAVRAEFADRVRAYLDLRERAIAPLPPLTPLPDRGEIRRRADAIAAAIAFARRDARPGDMFTSDLSGLIRRTIRTACGGDYAALLAVINESLDFPLAPAVVHGRWPLGAPLPTMPPDLLAVLPPLPPVLQYRFLRGDLALWDVEANLILDFIPDVIPLSTCPATGEEPPCRS